MKKQVFTFKKLDAWFQIFFLTATSLVILFSLLIHWDFQRYFLYAYFSVGSVQLLSFMVNGIFIGMGQSLKRKIYACFLLVLALLLIPPLTFWGLYALLFFSPFLAFFYAYLNYQEFRKQSFFL